MGGGGGGNKSLRLVLSRNAQIRERSIVVNVWFESMAPNIDPAKYETF